jgi:4-amino-4-deoxy-L-arabinose transferase-like glycosyltransferase
MTRTLVYLAFALLILVTHLGSLSTDGNFVDESTFILMAADLLRGHLPYLGLFDNKPPGLFFALAGAFSIFGENLMTVRLFGEFCVFATCVATFEIARRWVDGLGAGLAVAAMIAVTALPFGQHTQTGQLAMALAMSGLWLVVSSREHLGAAALSGVLLSLAVLTSSNLGFLVVALGIYYAFAPMRPGRRVHRTSLLAFVLGGLLPLAALVVLYIVFEGTYELWLSIVKVPLSYASNQNSSLFNLQQHTIMWAKHIINFPWIFIPYTLLIFAGIVAIHREFLLRRGLDVQERREDFFIILLMFAATFFSVLQSGPFYPHYWNQLLPFATIFIARAFATEWRGKFFLASTSSVAVVSAIVMILPSTVLVLTDWEAVKKSHQVRIAANLISADREPSDKVWALDRHLILWYLGDPPLSRASTHPSNITLPSIINTLVDGGYVPADELDRLFSSLPRYLISGGRKVPYYFHGKDAEKYTRFVFANYYLWENIGELFIFKRNEPIGQGVIPPEIN